MDMAYLDKVSLGGTTYDVNDTKGRAMIAPKEETSTASAAHAAGSYFTYNDLLYRATADIASGGTITPNTNCVAVTVGGDVSDLKSAFDDITETGINKFDWRKAQAYKNIDSAGNVVDSPYSYYYVSAVIPVPSNSNYISAKYRNSINQDNYISGANATLFFYDASMNFTPPHQNVMGEVKTIPNGAAYMRVKFNAQYYNIQKVIVAFTNDVNLAFEPFAMLIKEEALPNYIKLPKIVTVGIGKDFTSFVSAINSIADSSEIKPYIVEVYEGEYETVVTSLIGTTDPYTGVEYKGLIIPDYVSIIGIGNRDNIIIKGTLPKPEDNPTQYAMNANAISTINLVANSKVENITILAENIRYCDHDDGSTFLMVDSEHTFNNVHFIYNRLDQDIITESGGIAAGCVGIGGMHNKKATFNNCIFENRVFNKPGIVAHDGYLSIIGLRLNVYNSIFNLNQLYASADIIFASNSSSILPCYLNLIGNVFFNGIRAETPTGRTNNIWKVFARGNKSYRLTKSGGIADTDISADIIAFGNVTD
jgi:hypothetical protein